MNECARLRLDHQRPAPAQDRPPASPLASTSAQLREIELLMPAVEFFVRDAAYPCALNRVASSAA